MPIPNDVLLTAEQPGHEPVPLYLADPQSLPALRAQLPPRQARWLEALGYRAQRHRLLVLPPEGERVVSGVLWGLGGSDAAQSLSVSDAAALPERLPPGTYRIAGSLAAHPATQFALGWLLGHYRFDALRSSSAPAANVQLVAPPEADLAYARAAAEAIALARDLINMPANRLGPEELASAAMALARETDGQAQRIEAGRLASEYPLVAAVGAGSARAPCLIDCRWRRPGAPRVTLVGKGVCFDSGGLDLKPSSAMLLMKKDMGGAACALGLAKLLRLLDVPVELRLLVPAVENSVGGRSFRPGDVWRSRKGLTVEIGNTDAEGRLILADALADADAERPDLLVDLATLTGAARSALGPDLPALFGSDRTLVDELVACGETHDDPLWPLPFWAGYDGELDSRVADLNNIAGSPFAGAIIAALFLKRFVTDTAAWLHIDLYAWNPRERPGRPVGAEAQAIRALYHLIRRRFG